LAFNITLAGQVFQAEDIMDISAPAVSQQASEVDRVNQQFSAPFWAVPKPGAERTAGNFGL